MPQAAGAGQLQRRRCHPALPHNMVLMLCGSHAQPALAPAVTAVTLDSWLPCSTSTRTGMRPRMRRLWATTPTCWRTRRCGPRPPRGCRLGATASAASQRPRRERAPPRPCRHGCCCRPAGRCSQACFLPAAGTGGPVLQPFASPEMARIFPAAAACASFCLTAGAVSPTAAPYTHFFALPPGRPLCTLAASLLLSPGSATCPSGTLPLLPSDSVPAPSTPAFFHSSAHTAVSPLACPTRRCS